MLISQVFSPIALRNGMQPAFRYLKHTITYKEFWETSNRYSYYLQKELGHGRRVGLWMSNCPHVAYSFIALSNTKSCTVPLNPWASPEENLFKIKNAEITAILCSSDHAKSLKEFLHQNGHGTINVIDIESKRCAEYDTSYTPPANHMPIENDEILLFYTPGTTGKYKGCLFNHKAVAQAVTSVKSVYKTIGSDVFYTQQHYGAPFAFIHYLLAPLAAGASVFISDQVDPKVIVPNLTEFRVTRMAPNPMTLHDMLKTSEAEKMPIPTVKHFSLVNASSFSKEFWVDLKRICKANVLNVYGATEYLGTIAMGTPDVPVDPAKPNMCGPALIGTKIRVVDDNNDEIDKKKPQKGQLLVMGPQLMSKYLGLAEDQKMNVRGTWFFTGDVVELDSKGNVVFLERKADIVTLQTGVKIFPKDIEPVVRQIQQVEELAYIGVRDRMKKPIPALVIVRKAQLPLNEKQVMDFLATKLTRDKLPVGIFFVDAMPRTVSGAINRAKLRSQYDGV